MKIKQYFSLLSIKLFFTCLTYTYFHKKNPPEINQSGKKKPPLFLKKKYCSVGRDI